MIEVNESNRPSEEEIEIVLLAISRQYPNCETILRTALIALGQNFNDAVSAYDEVSAEVKRIQSENNKLRDENVALRYAAERSMNFFLNHQRSLGIEDESVDEFDTTKAIRHALAMNKKGKNE